MSAIPGVHITGLAQVERVFALSGQVEPFLVEAEADYALYVELGTRNMTARPFMRNAAQKGAAKIPSFKDKSDTVNELIKLTALEIERIGRSRENTPHRTGNLRRSIKARKLEI